MNPSHVLHERWLSSASDLADLALVELLLLVDAFLMQVSVILTRKSLLAVGTRKVFDLVVNRIDVVFQGGGPEEPMIAKLARVIQDLEVDAGDVAHQVNGSFEGLVATVTLVVARI